MAIKCLKNSHAKGRAELFSVSAHAQSLLQITIVKKRLAEASGLLLLFVLDFEHNPRFIKSKG